MKHPWINEGYPQNPLEPAPFPAFKTSDQLNCHVLTRMTESLGYSKEEVVRFVCENRASSATATYHLMDKLWKVIAHRRRCSGLIRPRFSDSQLDMQFAVPVPRQTNAFTLLTEPSSSFKEAVRAMNQCESAEPQKMTRYRCSEAASVNRSSTDSMPQSNTSRQVEQEEIRLIDLSRNNDVSGSTCTDATPLRKASSNALGNGCGRRRQQSEGLKLSMTYPGKSNRVSPTALMRRIHSNCSCFRV